MTTIRSELGFKPRCMATALSTVPFRNPEEACRIMLKNFPEAPCVPKLSLSMRRYIDGMPCLVIDRKKRRITFNLSRDSELLKFYERYLAGDLEYFAMDSKCAPGFYTFLEILRQSPPPELKMVHLGLPGPLAWGLAMNTQQTGMPAWYDATMRDILIRTLIMKAKWQKKNIREIIPEVRVVVSIGEPSLGVVESPFGSVSAGEVMGAINELLNGIDSIGEVHCCSNMEIECNLRRCFVGQH